MESLCLRGLNVESLCCTVFKDMVRGSEHGVFVLLDMVMGSEHGVFVLHVFQECGNGV